MKNITLILAFVLFASACDEATQNEKDVINKDKMAKILIDIHLAESKVNQVKLPLDSALSYYKYLEGGIYKKYNIDSAGFETSMHYYSENIRELDKIYEVVLDSLNLRAAQLEDAEEDEDVKKVDNAKD